MLFQDHILAKINGYWYASKLDFFVIVGYTRSTMGQTHKTIHITPDEDGKRLDILLSEKLGITRSQAKKNIDGGLILVNGNKPKKAGDIVHVEDTIETVKLVKEKHSVIMEDSPITGDVEILEETPDYIVLNKPAGLLIHPTQAQEKKTLTAWLLKKYPEIKNVGENPVRPGIVHRLDKETSGLLVIARTQKMFIHLKQQFKDRAVQKIYSVLIYGVIDSDKGIIDFQIDRGSGGKMAARPKTDVLKLKNVGKIQKGKEALTEFFVEKRFTRFTLLKVHIHTGRTNQIRVHMFAYGHPVVGDTLYMNKKLIKKSERQLGRLFLCAKELCFKDLQGQEKCFGIELPTELKDYLKKLR